MPRRKSKKDIPEGNAEIIRNHEQEEVEDNG